jgi:hypothetical protein
MASSLSQLSACVTRILTLTGFPKELKTRDIQTAFAEWENVNGGFKIKWIDDTSLLIVFQDATVAKRAYLHALAFPPAVLSRQNTEAPTVIRPYDGPDAQTVIQTVNSRHSSNPSRAHNSRNSISHGRSASAMSTTNSFRNGVLGANGSIPEHSQVFATNMSNAPSRDREPSPTLPSLPSHPTLNSLISSTLGSGVEETNHFSTGNTPPPADPAIVAIGGMGDSENAGATPPRIGDPGKRMLGHALGMRHPGLGPRIINGVQRTASGSPQAYPVAVIAE